MALLAAEQIKIEAMLGPPRQATGIGDDDVGGRLISSTSGRAAAVAR